MKPSCPTRSVRPLGAVLSLLAAAGCASVDTSELRGERFRKAPIDTYAVTVNRVDDRDYLQQPVRVEPGVRRVTVQAPPGGGMRQGETRTFTLDVQPCTRYFLVAVKPTPLSQDFEPKVDHAEPIGGCRAGP